MKKAFLFILLTLVALQCACGGGEQISYAEDFNMDEEDSTLDSEESKVSLHAQIYVYVSGCVASPGVYIMPEGSRVYDAVNAAGGVTADGDESHLNLVNIIRDGDRVVVPARQEYGESYEKEGSKVVNINRATTAQLMTVPGIGESKAKAIIEYRDKHGAFSKIEDIMKVAGIKEGTFEKIRDYIEAY